MLAGDIIQQLNEASARRGWHFPDFSVFFPVDARLSAYRDESHWAILLETLVFNDGPSRHDCCPTMLFCFGDNLPHGIGNCGRLTLTGDAPSGPLFDPEDVTGIRIAPTAKEMRIRGNIVPITTDPSAYAAAGIELSDPPWIKGHELLRLIAPKYRRWFFASEDEISERIGGQLPLLLRLYEWHHPDVEAGELPADSESFQMIAKTIAANDPTLYRPHMLPNTHWRNWPAAGLF